MLLLQFYRSIPRPNLGLKFEAIKFLDPIRVEHIWRKLNIDDGLIVEEVFLFTYLFTYYYVPILLVSSISWSINYCH
jgi:hypothetical protein